MNAGTPGPQSRPAQPLDVLNDNSKSLEEKEEYLENWRLDLLERIRATEENMGASGLPGDEHSELLRQVDKALAMLRGS